MAGFEVFYRDLVKAADQFKEEASAYNGCLPKGGTTRPDSGDGGLNQTLGLVLEALGDMHTVMVQAVSSHGQKIQTAHDNYVRSEAAAAKIFNDIVQSGPPLG